MRLIGLCLLLCVGGCSLDIKSIGCSSEPEVTKASPVTKPGQKKTEKTEKPSMVQRLKLWNMRRKARKEAKRIAKLKQKELKLKLKLAKIESKLEMQKLKLSNTKMKTELAKKPKEQSQVDKVIEWAADHLSLIGLIFASLLGAIGATFKFFTRDRSERSPF